MQSKSIHILYFHLDFQCRWGALQIIAGERHGDHFFLLSDSITALNDGDHFFLLSASITALNVASLVFAIIDSAFDNSLEFSFNFASAASFFLLASSTSASNLLISTT